MRNYIFKSKNSADQFMWQGRLNYPNPSIGGSYRTVNVFTPMIESYFENVYTVKKKEEGPPIATPAISASFSGDKELAKETPKEKEGFGSVPTEELEAALQQPIKVS